MKLQRVLSIIAAIFVVQAAVFSYYYVQERSLVRVIETKVPAVVATPPSYRFSIYGPWDAQLEKPMAVAVQGKRIYVSDTRNSRIQVFDYDGKPLFMFGSYGRGPGQFRFPYGIALDGAGRIYVADLYNGKVSIFDAAGVFQGYFAEGEFRVENDIIPRPAGLFISDNQLFVTDVGRHKVMAFTLDGNKVLEFGKFGKGDGELISPNAVAVTGDRIYVVDTGNDRVAVYDRQGNFLSTFNGSPDGKGTPSFVNPRGIGISEGLIYLVSNLTNQVQVFKSTGERVLIFGEPGRDEKQFSLPNGLYVDDQGRIYITDTVNQRVAVYES